jgi:hypothetical protein
MSQVSNRDAMDRTIKHLRDACESDATVIADYLEERFGDGKLKQTEVMGTLLNVAQWANHASVVFSRGGDPSRVR